MRNPDRLIATARFVVGLGSILNRAFLFALVTALCLSWVFSSLFASFLHQSDPGVDVRSESLGLRLLMLIGIAAAAASDRLLAALKKIVDSARAGDPFVAANAGRLQRVGWWLLALQLLDLPGALPGRFFPSLGSAAPSVDISPGSWLAVLMVFVLSRVFTAGSAMRDELDATI